MKEGFRIILFIGTETRKGSTVYNDKHVAEAQATKIENELRAAGIIAHYLLERVPV